MTDTTTNTTPAAPLTPEREADEPQTMARGLTPTEALLRLMADTTSSKENATAFAEAADKERQAQIRERWAGALYESVHAFQMAAQLGGLQHAQMRGYLAEHLRDFLLGEGGPVAVLLAELDRVRAELSEARERWTAGLRRADEQVREMNAEVQRYADGDEQPVLWSVYNAMHKRASTAEARVAELEQQAAEQRAAALTEGADAIDAETRQAKADGVLEPDKYRPCRDASAQLRRMATAAVDGDGLCQSEFPGDDMHAGQLCTLPTDHDGEHRCSAAIAGTSQRRALAWT